MSAESRDKALCLIPCFNEEANLPELLEEIQASDLAQTCDVLFVDDGSSDATPSLLSESPWPSIRHPKNSGYGAAIKSGLRHAHEKGYRFLAVFPGDRQRHLGDLQRLLAEMERGPLDLAIGNKLHGGATVPWKRSLGNRFFSLMARTLWNSPFKDVLSGFKAYRVASVMPFLDSLPDRYEFDIVFSYYCGKLGLSVREIPVAVRYHAHSTKMTSELRVGARMLAASLKSLYGPGKKEIVQSYGE